MNLPYWTGVESVHKVQARESHWLGGDRRGVGGSTAELHLCVECGLPASVLARSAMHNPGAREYHCFDWYLAHGQQTTELLPEFES